ncbi:hypothetical protein Ari01nite_92320 [Paractinoplanes rishiriensis]|uniref:Site-2 protease family protein n=1 Tax=Paractinoplanes rishiriensis TaxID=1050105 RepID=A0A919N2T2_9ACTN|nr:hypothetical protein Ari01nite_92320 [Actinoplanes rishiriensis]
MRQSIRLGTAHGIPVGVHWSTVLILFLLTQGLAVGLLPAAAGGYAIVAYWLAAAGFTGLFLMALLAHEYAHARTAQHYGIRVRAITLWLLGGVFEIDGDPPVDVRTARLRVRRPDRNRIRRGRRGRAPASRLSRGRPRREPRRPGHDRDARPSAGRAAIGDPPRPGVRSDVPPRRRPARNAAP